MRSWTLRAFKCKIFALVRIRSRSLTQIFCFSELAHKHIHDGRTRHDRQSGPRPGGRARVQAAVHQAVRELQGTGPRWADGACGGGARGRDPSTIYRRWGDLSQLLADVAVEQLQPEQAPPDTGSFYGDLLAWLEQYFDEMFRCPGAPCCATCWARRATKGRQVRRLHAPADRGDPRARHRPGRAGRRGGADHHARGGAARVWRCSPTRRRAPPGCWRWFGKWRPPGMPARRESARRDSC